MKTLDLLFLVQVAACLVLAIALLATRHVLVVAAAWLLMAGTIVGFILARSVGIFGFKLNVHDRAGEHGADHRDSGR